MASCNWVKHLKTDALYQLLGCGGIDSVTTTLPIVFTTARSMMQVRWGTLSKGSGEMGLLWHCEKSLHVEYYVLMCDV